MEGADRANETRHSDRYFACILRYDMAMDKAFVIETLRRCQPELRRMGIASVSLFGSVARGQASAASDIDLLVRYDPAARLSLLDVVHIENYLAGVFGRPVQLVREPIERPRMRARVEAERLNVF